MLACKIDNNGDVKGQSSMQKNKHVYGVKSYVDRNVPNACTLIGKQYIAKLFDISPDLVSVKDGNPSGKHSRGCFYRWDTPEINNAGVLITIQKNSRPDLLDDWAAKFIHDKIDLGEGQTDAGTGKVKYIAWDAGTAGAFSHELAKYFFQIDDEIVFMVAFNMNSHPAQQLQVATEISKKVLTNFLEKHK